MQGKLTLPENLQVKKRVESEAIKRAKFTIPEYRHLRRDLGYSKLQARRIIYSIL